MSFRSRLTLFFVLIVIVPMISVAFVLFRLIEDNESGKADARIAASLDAASNIAQAAQRRADEAALRIGRDPAVAAAIRARDAGRLERALDAARRKQRATRAVFAGEGVRADVGRRLAVFPATRDLVDGDGAVAGRLQVGVDDAVAYAKLVREVTGLEVVLRRDSRTLAATLDGSGAVAMPSGPGEVDVAGDQYRVATFTSAGFEGAALQVAVLEPAQRTTSDVRDSRLLAAGILAGFFILAFTFAVLVSRSLQRQIEGFLDAARRLGAGDFSAEVPTIGRDEFAALGGEFNKMSRQLEARLEDLRQERKRLELSLQRIGETFASNLDRDALLDIVVSTAVDGVGADGGRATVLREGRPIEVARAGARDLERPGAVALAEERALSGAMPEQADSNGVGVLSYPLRAGPATGDPGRVTGVISVWRTGRTFSPGERELFQYLAGQAAVSLENVGLHETVERQAVTDELTGLSNRRRFQETLTAEVERSRRFGQQVGLVMLDIDDFKLVNDTYGHQQGDVVLREVARILRETSREIDEPARYGGEELAVVLPGTDLDGAFNLAERVREGIEQLRLPLVNGSGDEVRVTASFGVAALPRSAADERALVAAADEALYEAKRAGKNRTCRAAEG